MFSKLRFQSFLVDVDFQKREIQRDIQLENNTEIRWSYISPTYFLGKNAVHNCLLIKYIPNMILIKACLTIALFSGGAQVLQYARTKDFHIFYQGSNP